MQAAALRATHALAATLRAQQLRPVCRTLRVESGGIYYQCVYVRMRDDDALLRAHSAARAAFGAPAPPGAAFMPHLSIIYGDLSADEKARRVASVSRDWTTLTAEEDCFEPASLALWRTPSGQTELWTEVADVPLAE